jgi:hypothetical protein
MEHLHDIILHALHKPDSIMPTPPRAQKHHIAQRLVLPRKHLRAPKARHIAHCDALAPQCRALLAERRYVLHDFLRRARHQRGYLGERGEVGFEEGVEDRLGVHIRDVPVVFCVDDQKRYVQGLQMTVVRTPVGRRERDDRDLR